MTEGVEDQEVSVKYVCFVLSPKSASALPGVEVTVGGL